MNQQHLQQFSTSTTATTNTTKSAVVVSSSKSIDTANNNNNNDLLPESFIPTNRDVICGRARENFHHGK